MQLEAEADDLPGVAGRRQTSPAERYGLIVFAISAFLVGLGYSFYTGQDFEDSLITLRYSENLVKGEGLVYNSGERVHGFTSPINVLLLAACHLISGQSSHTATFWLYRLLTIAAFAGGGVLLLRALMNAAPRWTPGLWFLGVAYMFEAKSVGFSTNGMETGFMLLFVGWAVYLFTLGPDYWIARGLCWAGLMWTRPDGCIYIIAFALAELLFLSEGRRRATLVSLAKSASVAVVVYSPWLIWAWWYYGSPIPHTVIAKANVERGTWAQSLVTFDNFPQAVFERAARAYLPVQYDAWVLPPALARVVAIVAKGAGLCCLLYWIYPVRDRLGRAASLCFTLLCVYFSYQTLSAFWYYPPAVALGLVALTRAATVFVSGTDESYARRALAPRHAMTLAALFILALLHVGLFVAATRAERVWQWEIETNHRAAIGLWLKSNGKPSDTVYLEPVGYIGYFSGMRIIDHPGLVSPQVVRLRREKQFVSVEDLKPDWIVLRSWEASQLLNNPTHGPEFENHYEIVASFDVNDKLNQYGAANDAYIRYDAAFVVSRRKVSLAPPGPPPTD